MTKMTVIKTTLIGLMAATMTMGCASELPTALDSANIATQDSFTQNGNFSLEGFGPGGPGGPGAMRKGHGGPGFGHELGADIDLSDEQKAALQAIEAEVRTFREENKPEISPEDARAVIDAAFASDTFDVAALKAKLAETQPDFSALETFEAEMMIKRYQVLTDEQKATLKEKRAEREAAHEAKLGDLELNRPKKLNGGPLDKLTQDLGLSDEQVAALEAAKEANAPDAEARKANRDAIQAELEKASPSVETLAALLAEGRPDNHLERQLEHMSTLHSVLTAEQRSAFIELQPADGPRGGHPGGHGMGGPGDRGRHGQPGMGEAPHQMI